MILKQCLIGIMLLGIIMYPSTVCAGASDVEPEIVICDDTLSITELIIIDPTVPKQDELRQAMLMQTHSPRYHVVVLDQAEDAWLQIIEAVDQHPYQALHLVTHAHNGTLMLGDAVVNISELRNQSNAIKHLGTLLAPDADVLFYGCNLAADTVGRQWVDEFAQLAQADVAASTDLTGHASLGGDWLLEYQIGQVEAILPFNQEITAHWHGLLQTTHVSYETGGEDKEFSSKVHWGQTFTNKSGSDYFVNQLSVR